MSQPLRLAIHIVTYSDGSEGLSLNSLDIAKSNLNNSYEVANMQFYIYSIDTIMSDTYADLVYGYGGEMDELRTINVVPASINVYFVPSFPGFCGEGSPTPALYEGEQGIIIANECATTSAFPHEMGHYFNLFHTHEFERFGVENITSNQNDDCYNADVAGDLLSDTPADPNLKLKGIYQVNTNCSYAPNIVSRDGCNRTDYSPDTHNMMSYSRQNCRDHFTEQQITRMNHTLTTLRSELLQLFVTVDQRNSLNQKVGVLKKWEGSFWSNNFNPGTPFNFPINSEKTIFGDQTVISNEKYNRWTTILGNESNVINYHSFITQSNDNTYTSRFEPTQLGTTIKNSLEGTTISGGNIDFADPWYIDYADPSFGGSPRNRGMKDTGADALLYRTRISPFYPDNSSIYQNGSDPAYVYQGVFLNQPYTGNNPVYYSVKVDEVQSIDLGGTIGTRNFYFQNWSADPPGSAVFQNEDALETPVVFKSDGATVQANLKGHLLTNSPTATAPNNQRKIVQGSNGYWAMVYESMGEVWLSRSTDGTNWEKEIMISNGFGEASCPSISVYGNYAIVLWQEIDWYGSGNGFNNARIKSRLYSLNDNTLYSTEEITYFNIDDHDFRATPVMDGYWGEPSAVTGLKVVAWREPDGIKIREYIKNNDAGVWSSIGTITGTNSSCRNPSVVWYSNRYYFFCWEDDANDKIKYIETSGGYSPWSFYSSATISPSYWTENISPQMTLVGGNRPTIVWRSENNAVENGTSVNVRQRIGSTWQNITSFSQTTIESLNPVIGDYYAETKMDVLWNISNYVYKASFNGSSWSGPAYVTSSGGPSSINRKTDYQTKAVWQKIDNTIGFYTVGGTAPPAKTVANSENEEKALPYRLNRHAIIELPTDIDSTAKGSVCFEIAGINLIYNDSEEKINYSTDENNLLASEPFKVATQGMQLSFAGAIYGVGLELPEKFTSKIAEPLAKVVLKDSQTDKVLQNLWVNNPSMLDQVQDKTFGEFKKQVFDLDKYLGKTVYVDIEMIGKAKGIKPLLVDDYLVLSDSNSIAKSVAQKDITGYELPTDYILMQNFPNPFNPSTTIAFYLPKAEYTTLKIYNVLGKEVMTVVNENIGQGYHSIDINMSGEPSGVYFYSLSAGSFSDTKKLLLLK